MKDTSFVLERFLVCLASLLGVNPAELAFIRKSENIVFQLADTYIVRVSSQTHRTVSEFEAEVEWISFLKEHGVLACAAVLWQGKLIQELCFEQERFTVMVFEKASGKPLLTSRELKGDREYIKGWGDALASLHSATKLYAPKGPEISRKQWLNVFPTIKEEHQDLQNKLDGIITAKRSYLEQLDKDDKSYGLIHCDFTLNNMFYEEGRFSIFDFDHSKYSWMIYDFAVIVDYVLKLRYIYKDKRAFIDEFLYCFLDGYEKKHHLTQYWMDQLPEFLKIWRLENTIAIINKRDNFVLEEWEKRVVDKLLQDVLNDVPLI